MGWGDEVIASGQARVVHARTGRRVQIVDRMGTPRGHEAWENNPKIVGRYESQLNAERVVNGPGVRPYIAGKSDRQWTWREWECPVGEIYLTKVERLFGAKYEPQVVVEPNIKSKASPNKAWGLERWTKLVSILRRHGVRPVQIGPIGTQVVAGAGFIVTPTMRLACAVLARARAAVLPEGGLHHAAAALGVPAVVIYGGFISPKQTGYALHKNLFTGGEACGMRVPCEHCAKAMAQIDPELVASELLALLQTRGG